MQKEDKIFIAGGTGMVGSAIINALKQKGYSNLIANYHSRQPKDSAVHWVQLDLTDQAAVHSFFAQHQPDYVVLAAAKVGGILANHIYRADFIYQNLIMEANVIHAAYEYHVKKLLFLGSSCIYPMECPQPMQEEHLLTGPLEYMNEPYAVAKIAGMKMCESYNLQYGTNFISVMPTNLYGPGDNFDLETSHVLPALIRKMQLGKCLEQGDWGAIRADLNARPIGGVDGMASKSAIFEVLQEHGISNTAHESPSATDAQSLTSVRLWGTGTPKREFMYSDDLAAVCLHILEQVDFQDIVQSRSVADANTEIRNCHINIGTGQEVTIAELAQLVQGVVGFTGEVLFDSTKPDGTPQKAAGHKYAEKTWVRESNRLKRGD